MSSNGAMPADNPAGRLHRFFTGVNESGDPSSPASWAVAQMWGLNLRTQRQELVRRVAVAMRLPDEVEREVRSVGADEADYQLELLSDWQYPFEHVLSSDMVDRGTFMRQVTPVSLHALRGVAYHLDYHQRLHAVTEPSADQVAELRANVTRLLADVFEAGEALGPDLRDFIVRNLRTIEDALADAMLRGPAAYRDARDQIVGRFVYIQSDVVTQANTPAGHPWATKLAAVILTLMQFASFGADSPQAIENARSLILSITAGPLSTDDVEVTGGDAPAGSVNGPKGAVELSGGTD